MRLRILAPPTTTVDGISFDHVRIGGIYELRTAVASVFLAEHWAELVIDDDRIIVADPSSAGSVGARPSVLVVDDDAEVRRLTEALLTAHGYQVLVAGQGREGIQRLCEQSPDLIVLDLNMPLMDGWQFRAEQRYLPDPALAAVPVLLMSAAEDAAAHALFLGAVGVIAKPFDPDDLLEAVSAAIGSQQSAPDGIRSTRPWRRRVPPKR